MTDYLPDDITVPATTAPAVPHSREAEEAVVGAVFINPEVYYDVAQFLSADDFYIHRHKWIWDCFTGLHEQRIPIDLLTVSDELDRRGQLGEIGGPAYLTSLVNQVPSSLNAESYGRIVEGYSVRRNMINEPDRIHCGFPLRSRILHERGEGEGEKQHPATDRGAPLDEGLL